MKRLLLTVAVVAAFFLVTGARADAAGGTDYYLALGDSLAQGFQPDGIFPPYYQADGYVPQVYAALSAADSKLVLENISCGGEGTVSMIDGSQPPSAGPS